jgi:spermidine synthase
MVSGFVALVYEVVWTAVLAMTLGPTTYAFSAMLVRIHRRLAIGAAIASALLRASRRPAIWLGTVHDRGAAAALAAAAVVDRLPIIIARTAGRTDASFMSVFALDVALAVAIQLPMTIALGAALPFAVAQRRGSGRPRRGSRGDLCSQHRGADRGRPDRQLHPGPAAWAAAFAAARSSIAVVAGLVACLRRRRRPKRVSHRARARADRSPAGFSRSAPQRFGVLVVAALMPGLESWAAGQRRLSPGARH